MLRFVIPAPMPDLLELYQATARMKAIDVKVAILQAAKSETIALYEDGVMIAATLFYPCDGPPGEDLREVAFACRPQAARHMLAIVRKAHEIMPRFTPATGDKTARIRIRARVRSGHAPGQRIARLCGLHLVGEVAGFELHEIETTHEQCG